VLVDSLTDMVTLLISNSQYPPTHFEGAHNAVCVRIDIAGSICSHIQLYYFSKKNIFLFTTNLVKTYIKWLIHVTFYAFMIKAKKRVDK